MIRRYSELDLWVRQHPAGKGFWVEVSYGKRVAQGRFDEPFSREELDAFREAVSKGRGRSIEARRLAKDLGKKLFNAVFAASLRGLWNRARQEARLTRGLRLRVRPAQEVAHWPWELLHSPRKFLALSASTPVVRHVGDPETLSPQWLPWPLRILVVIPSPSGCDALDGDKELREIQESLALYIRLRLVHVEKLDPPTLDSLEDRLNCERFDVLHFVGHGSFRQDEGVL